MDPLSYSDSAFVQRDQNALGQAHAEHPDWPAPNYDNAETRLPLLVGVSCAAGGLMVLLMGARMYTRGVLSKKGLGIDDLTMVVAATFGVALVIIVCICAGYGTGYHQWDLRPEWAPHWGKATFCQNLALVLAATLIKVSILLTYLFLFPQRSNQIFCWGGIIFVAFFGAANIIVTCLQCISVSKKSCIDINTYLYTAGAINSLTDVVVYLWPSRTLFELKLPLAKRLGLCFTFSAGRIAVVASVARLVSVHNASYSDDSTYSGTFIAPWKVLEVTFGVICGCLPAVKAIIKPLLPKALSGSKRTRSDTAPTYRSESLGRPEGRSLGDPHGEIDLQPMVHPSGSKIPEGKGIFMVGDSKRASDSEEWIIDRSESRHGSSAW